MSKDKDKAKDKPQYATGVSGVTPHPLHETTWRRGDVVLIEFPLNGPGGRTYEQLLVAADNPEFNDLCWLISADENNWCRVGKFETTEYVEQNNGRLLYRPTDRAIAAESVVEPEVTPRGAVLREAEGLIVGDRNKSYGTPTENFTNIAALWTTQFKHKLKDGESFTAPDVAHAQIHVKMARLIAQPKRDNYVDIAGYAGCGWEAEGVES